MTVFVYTISHLTSPGIGVISTGVGSLLWRGFDGRWVLLEGSAFRQIGGGGYSDKFSFIWVDSQASSAQNNFYGTIVYFSGSLHGSREIRWQENNK